MPAYSAITYELTGSVATITLNRPDAANTLNETLSSEMLDALTRGDGVAARAALEADIGRAFDLVMNDESLWQRLDGVA